MAKVLMCVPNLSEGRDLQVVQQIAEPVRGAQGVTVLECAPDPHHNRTVLSYVGEPERVLEATQAMAVKAFELIDMTRHRGAHPRLGAVDVVPFVPVRGMEMAEAVAIARRFGRFVGSLGVPVYYYEEAATRPERQSLVTIRKGEYEGLAARLQDPAWQPDEGPAVFSPRSGAMVTGARLPLIALNVNLRTTDLSVAERIARAVRHTSGGYRHVRAMAVPLEDRGMVQVSMNLTDYRHTPIPRVVETVRSEAARYGVAVAGSEIVGPVPLAALEEVVRHYLQAHSFTSDQ
ncbi:MAG: glutamate formimidoyltransferase, partial [Anaerolineae bacterium]|nr:glutamate formimidoyltransferase [Anaerolineae bacterium]